jgi:hypothetical protein
MRIRRWWAYLWRMTLWLIRFILFTLQMDKAEADRLSKELWELSEHEKQNKARMLEIAKVLVAYYMWDKEEKDKEKS